MDSGLTQPFPALEVCLSGGVASALIMRERREGWRDKDTGMTSRPVGIVKGKSQRAETFAKSEEMRAGVRVQWAGKHIQGGQGLIPHTSWSPKHCWKQPPSTELGITSEPQQMWCNSPSPQTKTRKENNRGGDHNLEVSCLVEEQWASETLNKYFWKGRLG